MAIVSIPHSWNQSARRLRSSVKVPNVRTGSEARSGPTAATCIFAPTSMAAARGWMGDIAREWIGLFFPVMPASPCVANSGRGWTAQDINFLTGITARRHHSQVRNNPWTTFFAGSSATKNLPAAPLHRQILPRDRFSGHRRAGEGFFEGNARARPVPSQPRSRPARVEGAARALRHELGSNSGSTGSKHRVAWRWHSSTACITAQRFLSSTAARPAAA